MSDQGNNMPEPAPRAGKKLNHVNDMSEIKEQDQIQTNEKSSSKVHRPAPPPPAIYSEIEISKKINKLMKDETPEKDFVPIEKNPKSKPRYVKISIISLIFC